MAAHAHIAWMAGWVLCLSPALLWAQAPAPAAEASPKAEAAAPPPVNNHDEGTKIRSLFFSPDEMVAIRMAVDTYKGRGGKAGKEEDFLDGLLEGKNDLSGERLYTYPQFFLESLAYRSPNDWVLWVNSQKISHQTAGADSDLMVTAIDSNKATFRWRPSPADRSKVIAVKKPGPGVAVDTLESTVQFTLHANQTFSSYVMRVLEGKVLPVTVELNSEMLQPTEPAEELDNLPSPIPPAGAATPPAPHEGLGGLIDAYQNLEGGKTDKKP